MHAHIVTILAIMHAHIVAALSNRLIILRVPKHDYIQGSAQDCRDSACVIDSHSLGKQQRKWQPQQQLKQTCMSLYLVANTAGCKSRALV